ncbi:hypothetical protein OC834_007819 [Tilletia horrida]|uniref:C2H2-type domain-containing protein n=1 Tax=Tilletia horrida TaxID=155126 RepID=A0AAN6JGY6_9BASI|nr:hypothetical protein OC834_007819 [Tilletia horrida]KAK0519978.1 hypothetical protein OC835_007357 [Tilletia horrida]KAK0520034.1 hypothetical protein OC842_007235 [Tilletia horrida]KAK0546218.1 hypothetical protein OC844_007276 [Tilletia horrida]
MTPFVPGPCVAGCGSTLNTLKYAKKHWRCHHRQQHPYGSRQGQREPQPLLSQWTLLPSTLPTYTKGLVAIQLAYAHKLHKSPPTFIATDLADSFSHKPWWDHIKSDLNHKDNANTAFISSIDSLPLDSGSAYQVDAGLFHSTQPDLPESVAKTLSAALDIRPTSNFGLKMCKYFINATTASYGVPAHGKHPDISMAITPAGHITEVHQDGIWDGSILIQLTGEKIIFMWPPTEDNLNVASHCHRGTGWLHDAIKNLTNGKMAHLTPGSKIFLPVGTLHAVLSLTPSALAGYRVHHASFLADIPRLLKWDVNTSLAKLDDHEVLNEILNEHDDLLTMWLQQRASSIERYERDLLNIKDLWERDLRPKLNSRLIDLSRPAKRARH